MYRPLGYYQIIADNHIFYYHLRLAELHGRHAKVLAHVLAEEGGVGKAEAAANLLDG